MGTSLQERFARLTHPEVDRALAAAFALISTADGTVDKSESARLHSILSIDDTDTPRLVAIADEASALAERMLADFDPAYRVATARLKELRDDPTHGEACPFILDVARSLVVADLVIAEREETALSIVARSLGLPTASA